MAAALAPHAWLWLPCICLLPRAAVAQSGVCWVEEGAQLQPADLEQADFFGWAVALDGDRALIGAFGEDALGLEAGAAYTFRFDGSAWLEEQTLTASDGFGDQEFGRAVALSGDLAVVGSPGQNCEEAAYVFRFDGSSWSEEHKLTPSSASLCNSFGIAVAVSGDGIAVGAKDDTTTAPSSGSTFVYRYDGVQWNQEQKLVGSGLSGSSDFGSAVALAGDDLLIGAQGDSLTTGAVHCYERSGAQWIERQKLVASDGAAGDLFGNALALRGQQAAVGAPRDDDTAANSGSVYVYTFDGATWSGEQKIVAVDPGLGAEFGTCVSLGDDLLAVGAPSAMAQILPVVGASYLFRMRGGAWLQQAKYTSQKGTNGDMVGQAVALSGARVLAGAPGVDPTNAGAGYLFAVDDFALDASLGAGGLTLLACGGLPGASVRVAVTQLGGVPTSAVLAWGVFDAEGSFAWTTAVPAALSGKRATFRAASSQSGPGGGPGVSNLASVVFP